jgi:2-keto-4-pentenoate hydratase/2-oxohepta-3-ene-1,7-dioic acid hydratase in catechol pathway
MEKPGLIDADGNLRSLASIVKDIDGDALSANGLARIKKANVARLPKVAGRPRLGACVGSVGKFVAIGLNFTDHARETGSPIPKEPIVFNKWTTCLSGPFDNIVLPPGSVKTDWEVELAVVIGRTARFVSEKDALRYVAGYCVCNDVSEREYQIERGGGQWDKGKGCDTFGPLGPWMVTRDEIKDVQNLAMKLTVNGEVRQNGSTATMIFGVATLVSYLSRFMTLEPGDVITTGTPPGVGLGMKPPQFLKAGDVVELSIEGLGTQRQKVVASRERAAGTAATAPARAEAPAERAEA